MSNINGVNSSGFNATQMQNAQTERANDSGSSFGDFMGDVADGALAGVAAVAPFFPGGELVKMAANGLRGLSDQAPGGLGGAKGEKLDQMWEMQEQNQMFNLQYMHLQQELQSDNRHFSTMSNLLKARHDTAKAAINNMRV
jgi:hypothetical protein